MDVLKRFGSGSTLYTFDPDNQIQYRDNFRDAVPRITKLPGVSGGFDEYGTGPAPDETGNVEVQFWVFATSEADMLAKKRAIGAMSGYGKKRLYKQPVDPVAPEVYCEARINSARWIDRSGDRPEKRIKVTINYQVDNPRWLGIGTESAIYGDGTTYGSGATYGGSPVTQNLIGSDNTVSVTPDGNQITYPRLTIEVPTGKSATNIRIQREVDGSVVDKVTYAGTLTAGDIYEINCRAYAVYLNGVDGYDDDFSFITSGWLRLLGGVSNTIRVLMDNPTDEIDLSLRYYDVYNV